MTQEGKEKEKVCETCGGEGVISKMEAVYPGEPHMADIGEQPCPDCSGGDTEDDYDPDA
jgi:DnaJ-class molecular chaperone